MKDSTVNKQIILLRLWDAIRMINVINISFLIGIFMTYLGLNRYASMILMLFICILLSIISIKVFNKRILKNRQVPKSLILIVFTVLFNLSILAYYFYIKEFITAIILLVFQIGILFWMYWKNKKNDSKKLGAKS